MEFDKEEISAAAPLLPKYYCKALSKLSRAIDLRGARLLEVGGYSVPRTIANDMLGVAQWVSVDMLDFSGGTYQMRGLSDYLVDRSIQSLREGSLTFDGDNTIVDADILEFSNRIDERFDVIFSVNCFEHMPKFFDYMQSVKNNLAPGGLLFTQFGPIWSCACGSHVRVDQEINFANPGFLENFEHLLLSKAEMIEHLRAKGIDLPRAIKATYHIYDSPAINRYTYDDYVYAFHSAGFASVNLSSTFKIGVADDRLETLSRRYPGLTDFTTYEITARCRA